jgi:hypothetical protein
MESTRRSNSAPTPAAIFSAERMSWQTRSTYCAINSREKTPEAKLQ